MPGRVSGTSTARLYREQGHPFVMAILTLTCPKCEKTALIDDEDAESFCLHCGNLFTPEERAGADASGLYDLMQSIDYANANVERFCKKPWYDDMISFRTVLGEEGPAKAAKVFDDLISSNPDDVGSIAECATIIIVDWAMAQVDAPAGYCGGVLDMIDVLCKHTSEKSFDVMGSMLDVFLASVVCSSDGPDELMKDMGSALTMMVEAMRSAYDIIGVLEMCVDYIRFTDGCLESVGCMVDDDAELAEYAEHIELLRDFVKIIGDTISDATSDEAAVDAAVDAWLEVETIDHGGDILAFTQVFLDGNADLAPLKPLVEGFLSRYMSRSA